jgi:hypothetical protein
MLSNALEQEHGTSSSRPRKTRIRAVPALRISIPPNVSSGSFSTDAVRLACRFMSASPQKRLEGRGRSTKGAKGSKAFFCMSLNRPGGNVTGMAGVTAELADKSVEIIRELRPSAHRVVALANAPDPFSNPFLEHIRRGGVATGTTIDAKMIRSAEELEAAFSEIEKERADAVIVQPSLPSKRSAELALRYRIPAVSAVRGFVDEGGLMSYAAAEADMSQPLFGRRS